MRGYVKIPHIVRIILDSGGNIIDAAVAVEYTHFTPPAKAIRVKARILAQDKTSPRQISAGIFLRECGLIESVTLPDFVIFSLCFGFGFTGFGG